MRGQRDKWRDEWSDTFDERREDTREMSLGLRTCRADTNEDKPERDQSGEREADRVKHTWKPSRRGRKVQEQVLDKAQHGRIPTKRRRDCWTLGSTSLLIRDPSRSSPCVLLFSSDQTLKASRQAIEIEMRLSSNQWGKKERCNLMSPNNLSIITSEE